MGWDGWDPTQTVSPIRAPAVLTNIRVTTLLCRCNNKYLDIIWKLHCYNLSALLQQLCVEIILLQLLNVVTVFITTYSLNVVTMEYFIVTITITSFTHALSDSEIDQD